MSREIKFRAWHIPSKTWLTNEESLSIIMLQGRVSSKIADDKGLLSKHVIEQFTGLTDKNGDEIYEGDIVKTIHHIDGNFINMGIVKYCIIFEKFSFQMKPVEPAVYTVSMVLGEDTSIETIGNIHQNPELLKGKP